jgi:hypothetical protein
MREIVIKQAVSENHKRKNLSIVELIEENGLVAKAEKKFVYYVSEQKPVEDPAELEAWVKNHAGGYQRKDRHVSIQKVFDRKGGIGKMIYRVIGSFYVVQNLHIYAVVFMHTIKFDLLTGRAPDPQKI